MFVEVERARDAAGAMASRFFRLREDQPLLSGSDNPMATARSEILFFVDIGAVGLEPTTRRLEVDNRHLRPGTATRQGAETEFLLYPTELRSYKPNRTAGVIGFEPITGNLLQTARA